MIDIAPSDLVQEFLTLSGEPYSIRDYPYLKLPYNTQAREVGLFTARQVAKSTLLASKLVVNALTQPNGRQVLVSPLQEQAYVFSMQRLYDFTAGSPKVAEMIFSNPDRTDQVLRKIFDNGHMITLGYAQRTADRLRGQSIKDGGLLGFDEIQDILPEVIPVIKELAFRARRVTYLYAGTPKSYGNHMEKMRARSTGCEWAVKCQHMGCRMWNLEWDERNIGDAGVICRFCGQPINTNLGEWVRAREMNLHLGRNATVTMEAFRIPQLIVKPIMDDPYKYRELLDKLQSYSSEKFHNEVLGLPFDSGSQPVTYEQLARCCVSDRPNAIPDPTNPKYPPLVAGLDWAFMGEDSYTYLVVGGWSSFPHKFEVYYHKIFKGNESNSVYQIQYITDIIRQYNIRLVGADWGAGHVQNLQLINEVGESRVAQLWHTGMKGAGGGGKRVKWEPVSRKFHLARTQVLTDTFEQIRREGITFPKEPECTTLFNHILAESLEHLPESNKTRYVNVEPDDGLHALTYAMLAGELFMRGDFAGHLGSSAPNDMGGAAPDWESDLVEASMGPADDYYM